MDTSPDPGPVPAGIPVEIPAGIWPADPGTCFPRIRPRSQVTLRNIFIFNDLRVPVAHEFICLNNFFNVFKLQIVLIISARPFISLYHVCAYTIIWDSSADSNTAIVLSSSNSNIDSMILNNKDLPAHGKLVLFIQLNGRSLVSCMFLCCPDIYSIPLCTSSCQFNQNFG